jgi:NosR/NirI family nitrous oxide reductase transcriptional regulator
MKLPVLAVTCVVAAAVTVVSGQAALDSKTQSQLKALFPQATGFSPKGGDLPTFKAYSGDPNAASPTVIGYAFYTTEMQPLERAYDGPIKWLVGMDTRGVLTGIVLVEHKEPYGNFSIETIGFQNQFKGKNIRDAFKVGADIDAISRATVSVTSSARAIRNSARRVARALLTPPGESR